MNLCLAHCHLPSSPGGISAFIPPLLGDGFCLVVMTLGSGVGLPTAPLASCVTFSIFLEPLTLRFLDKGDHLGPAILCLPHHQLPRMISAQVCIPSYPAPQTKPNWMRPRCGWGQTSPGLSANWRPGAPSDSSYQRAPRSRAHPGTQPRPGAGRGAQCARSGLPAPPLAAAEPLPAPA